MIPKDTPHDKAQALTQPAIWSHDTVPLATGQTCNSSQIGKSVQISRGRPAASKNQLLGPGKAPLGSVCSRQVVCCTTKSQVGCRAIWCVLASSCTAVPIAIGLMAHVGSTLLHSVFPGSGAFWVERFLNRMVNGPPV